MLTNERVREIVESVEYLDWRFHVIAIGHGWLVQPMWNAADPNTGKLEVPQKGRKWYVSPHAVEGEVLQTLLLAVLTAVEHEVRENFLVNGKAIYGPHKDPEQLARVGDERRD